MTDFKKYAQAALRAVLALAVLLLALWALLYHVDVWRFPQQLEPTEGGLMMSTKAVLAGLDPWDVKLAPVYSNNYGIGFPWAAALGSRLAPHLPLLRAMRSVTAACIFLILGLLYRILRDGNCSPLEAAAAVLAAYIPLLYFDIPSGRPDALAILLYIASLIAVLRPGLRWMPLAGALAVLAYFAKPYGLLALGLGGLHLARQGRWRSLLSFLMAALATAAAMTLWVLHLYPYYFAGTVGTLAPTTDYDTDWLLAQLCDLLRFHFPLLLLVAAAAARRAWLRGAWRPAGSAQDWAWLSAITLAVLIAGPGRHVGAYLRYFNELLVPLALMALVLWARQMAVAPWLLALALLGNAGLCWDYHRAWFYPVSAEDYAGWVKAGQWMDEHPHGFYPPLMTALAVEHHAYVVDTDHSRYLPLSRPLGHPSPLAVYALSRMRYYNEELIHGRLQTVVCGAHWPCPPDLEAMGYQQVEPICLRTPLAADRVCFSVYVPRHKRQQFPPKGRP